MLEALPHEGLPYLAELATEYVLVDGYAFGDEFARGLEFILDGLEGLR